MHKIYYLFYDFQYVSGVDNATVKQVEVVIKRSHVPFSTAAHELLTGITCKHTIPFQFDNCYCFIVSFSCDSTINKMFFFLLIYMSLTTNYTLSCHFSSSFHFWINTYILRRLTKTFQVYIFNILVMP